MNGRNSSSAILFLGLQISVFLSSVNAFVIQTPPPINPATNAVPAEGRIRNSSTKIFAASAGSAIGNINVVDELTGNTKTRRTTKKKVQKKPRITQLKSAEEYLDFLMEDDRLCMVKFYAPHCKSCQKTGMHYKRIGKEIGDLVATNKDDGTETIVREGEVRLAEMEYGANRELCKRLGVTKLPTMHFYSRGKKVDDFPCGPRKLPILLEKLGEYRSMNADALAVLEDAEFSDEDETVLEILRSEINFADLDSFC